MRPFQPQIQPRVQALWRWFVLLSLILTFSSAARSQTELLAGSGAARDGLTREALVEQALSVSQTARVMESVTQALAEALNQSAQFSRHKPEMRKRLADAIGRAYAPRRFVARIREMMREQIDEETLREFISASETSLAQRGLEMEIAASTASTQLIDKHARTMVSDPETMARIAAVTRLDNASGGTELVLAIVVSSVISSTEMQRRVAASDDAAANSAADAQTQDSNPAEAAERRQQAAKQEIERLSRSLRPKVHRDVLNSALFTYRWMSLTDLQAYTVLHEQPSMRRMAVLINDALGSTLLQAQRDAIEEILLELNGKGVKPV